MGAATRELFDERLDDAPVRARIRHALSREPERDASFQVYVHHPQPDARRGRGRHAQRALTEDTREGRHHHVGFVAGGTVV
ncbi:hypothetical protein [Streptomyces sp. Ac-502]|uniref:hypothetical protein n=1 Tax=Streptomyces sp. Ac-502 TaxID=3342801 RepID=UPI0038621FCB